MSRLFSVFILVSFFSVFAFAQGPEIDSLYGVLKRTKDPGKQVDLLNTISYQIFHDDLEKGYEVATQALKIAEEHQYKTGKRFALTLEGYYFFETGASRSALAVYQKGASVDAVPDDFLAYNYVLTGNVYRSLANYDSARQYYDKAISLCNALGSDRFLAFAYRNAGRLCVLQWKNQQAEEYFNKALELYKGAGNRSGQAEVLFALGDLHKNRADYPTAGHLIDEGCKLAEDLKDDYLKQHCLIYTGEIQFRFGAFLESLETMLLALEKFADKNEPRTLVKIYSGLADVYEVISQNDLALRYNLEALKISERLGLRYEMGRLYSNIAWIYKNQRDFPPAFEFLDKSLAIREEIGDEYGVSNSYNVKGIIFFQQKKYPEAVEWLERSLEIRLRIGHKEGVSACYYNMGLIHEHQKNYQEALKYQLKAYEYEKSSGNKFYIGISFSSIGSVYTYLNMFDSAKYYLDRAEEIGVQTGSLKLQMENAFYWSEFYQHQGKFKDALVWHQKYASLNDSVYHETSATKLAEMQALYQADQKDKEITLLNQEKLLQSNQLQLQKAQINLQNYVIVFIVVALVLVSLLAYKTYRFNREMKSAHREIVERKEELQTQSEELQTAYLTIAENNKRLEIKVEERTFELSEAYRELDTFFYRASHDFRRPLTTFLGLAEVAKITIADERAKELFEKVRETAVNLDKMLLKLQSISDLGSQQLSYERVNMSNLFTQVLNHFRLALEQKEISTKISCDVPSSFFSYPEMLFIILENLVENSIAFCRYKLAHISLRAYQEDGRVVIQVEDNGDGIEEKYQPRIFEMYFRGNDRSKGNGLGLYIIRKAVEKLQGKVSFVSHRDQGTMFSLSFPLGLDRSTEAVREVAERMHL